MPPRPTPRQRAVLEAMSDGSSLFHVHGALWEVVGVPGWVSTHTVRELTRNQWITAAQPGFERERRVITDSGRRAVAREDGGV